MYQILKYSFVLILLVISFNSCKESPEIKKEMIRLDKAMVPVWHAIQQRDMGAAKRGYIVLSYRWQQFERKYQAASPEVDDWQETFRLINDWVSDLSISLEANATDNAAVQMDHIIFEMMEFRLRNGIPYYLDYVWDFQMSYDMVQDIVNDPMLNLLEWCEVEEQVASMSSLWYVVTRHQPEQELMGWDAVTTMKYTSKVSQINTLVNDFNTVVNSAEKECIAVSCNQIEAELLDLISFFGDFESTKTYYANH